MSRKKFIKLCMSLGLSRNESNMIASMMRDRDIPYGEYSSFKAYTWIEPHCLEGVYGRSKHLYWPLLNMFCIV